MTFRDDVRVKIAVEDPLDNMSSCTLKRHPKMDLNKSDMLQLLSYLEGELQARDVAIAALQAEKTKQFLYQAKYGKFGLVDPLHALQRDSELVNDYSFDEAAIKAMYDDQLRKLENLILTQQMSQHNMREQLIAVENRYRKTCSEIEEEKLKQAQYMEQGDNVTYMLEKEREHLKQEVEFKKSQSKKIMKELRKTSGILCEDRSSSTKHKQVSVMLIRERTMILQETFKLRARCGMIEVSLKECAESFDASHSHNSQVLLETEFQQRISEFIAKCEQLRARLAHSDVQNEELSSELDRLRLVLNSGCGMAGGADNTMNKRRITDTGAQSSVVPSRHPHVYISERTVSPTPVTSTITHSKIQPSVKQNLQNTELDSSTPVNWADNMSSRISLDMEMLSRATGERITSAKPFAVLMSEVPPTTRQILDPNVISSCAIEPGNSEVGKKISNCLEMRRPTRGIPPPVPLNKPQMFMPGMSQSTSLLPKDVSITSMTISNLVQDEM